MKTWDAIVLGCGVIGASLARELHKSGMRVLVIERGEPGREATHAAAGMLAPSGGDLPAALQELADASAKIYPEFIRELEDEAHEHQHPAHQPKIDLRSHGTILLEPIAVFGSKKLNESGLRELEPYLEVSTHEAQLLDESSVDPRGLMHALLRSLKHRGVEIAHGAAVTGVRKQGGSFEVETERAKYSAARVVNCCGAWAGDLETPFRVPAKPRKGQMLSVIARVPLLEHVVRSAHVYLVPRSDGRILVGATVEDAGFDKRVEPETMKHLQQEAAKLVPAIAEAKIHESWAGLRPGTPDDLPILGESEAKGYFVATGHFRNGILLAPVTALLMSHLIRGEAAGFELQPFSPGRFA